MLRHPEALSPFSELERPRFQNVIPDETALDAKRVLLCTGKIGHELRMERRKAEDDRPGYRLAGADVSVPGRRFARRCSAAIRTPREFIWVQEEPANMGALSFVTPRLKRIRRPETAQRQARRELDTSDRFGKGARDGAEDADHAGAGEGRVG